MTSWDIFCRTVILSAHRTAYRTASTRPIPSAVVCSFLQLSATRVKIFSQEAAKSNFRGGTRQNMRAEVRAGRDPRMRTEKKSRATRFRTTPRNSTVERGLGVEG